MFTAPLGEEHGSPASSLKGGGGWQGFSAKAEMMKMLITLRADSET